MSHNDDLLTAGEVASQHRVTTTTVRRWVRAGHLPALRLPGGSLRFRRADVDAIAEQVPVTTGDAA